MMIGVSGLRGKRKAEPVSLMKAQQIMACDGCTLNGNFFGNSVRKLEQQPKCLRPVGEIPLTTLMVTLATCGESREEDEIE